MRSMKSPGNNPIVKRVMAYAAKLVPDLKKVRHRFCPLADKYYLEDSRVFAHTRCPQSPDDRYSVCWCRKMSSLSAMHVAGICFHELGHVLAGPMPGATEFDAERAADVAVLKCLNVEIAYIGKNTLQAVDLKQLEI